MAYSIASEETKELCCGQGLLWLYRNVLSVHMGVTRKFSRGGGAPFSVKKQLSFLQKMRERSFFANFWFLRRNYGQLAQAVLEKTVKFSRAEGIK